jgi:hypothetical protein
MIKENRAKLRKGSLNSVFIEKRKVDSECVLFQDKSGRLIFLCFYDWENSMFHFYLKILVL